jgi:hypothetical protein
MYYFIIILQIMYYCIIIQDTSVYSSTAVTLARLQVRVLDFPFAILDRLKTGGKTRGKKREGFASELSQNEYY